MSRRAFKLLLAVVCLASPPPAHAFGPPSSTRSIAIGISSASSNSRRRYDATTSLTASIKQRLHFNTAPPLREKEPPKLILISGGPGTGKSTFGMSLALEQGILKCISTDTVRAVMRSYVPESISPPLHRSSYGEPPFPHISRTLFVDDRECPPPHTHTHTRARARYDGSDPTQIPFRRTRTLSSRLVSPPSALSMRYRRRRPQPPPLRTARTIPSSLG
jgi:hypothetical protein